MTIDRTTMNLALLRFIAAVAIVLFSFEITSSLFIGDDVQMEIVDVDFDDEIESDDETNLYEVAFVHFSSEISASKNRTNFSISPILMDRDIEALPSPPPELV